MRKNVSIKETSSRSGDRAPSSEQLPSIHPPLRLMSPLHCGREREASGGYNELGVYLGVPRPLTRDIINQEGPTLKRNGGAPEGPRNAVAGPPPAPLRRGR